MSGTSDVAFTGLFLSTEMICLIHIADVNVLVQHANLSYHTIPATSITTALHVLLLLRLHDLEKKSWKNKEWRTATIRRSEICDCMDIFTWLQLLSFLPFSFSLYPEMQKKDVSSGEKKKKIDKEEKKGRGKGEVSWEADIGRRKFIHLCLIYSSRI